MTADRAGLDDGPSWGEVGGSATRRQQVLTLPYSVMASLPNVATDSFDRDVITKVERHVSAKPSCLGTFCPSF
jgi:hypothetical protein